MARSRGVRVLVTRPAGSDARVAFGGLRDLVGDSVGEVLPALPEPQRRALAVALLLEEPGTVPIDPMWCRHRSPPPFGCWAVRASC